MSDRGHSQDRALSQESETPFAGYGDRVGSGVAYTPTMWRGGEIVTDPSLINKSLKPRKFYYSPIGDGVVASDGVELKRIPPDLTPKVDVIQQRVVERGPAGKPGVRVTEKTWSTGAPGVDSRSGYGGSQLPTGPPSGDAARGQQKRPSEDPFANLADQLGGGAPRPTSAQSAPGARDFGGGPKDAGPWGGRPQKDGEGGPRAGSGFGGGPPMGGHGAGPGAGGPAAGGPGGSGGGPFAGSTRSTPGLGVPATNGTGGNLLGNDWPHSGRSSASLYEPGYRYEMKKDYKVTNPRELIHQYATTTPVTTIDPSIGETTRTITRQHYSQTVEESFGPFPPYTAGPNVPSPLKFVRQLRDETMTDSQRQANRQQDPLSAQAKDAQFGQRIEEIRRSTSRMSPHDPMVDQLSSQLQQQGGLGKHH